MSSWAIAPRTPTIIVSPAIHSSTVRCSPGNSCVWVRIIAYTPTLVSRPANTALIGLRAVGYESGSQKNSGNTAALRPKATSSSSCSPVRRPLSSSARRWGSSAMLSDPVEA